MSDVKDLGELPALTVQVPAHDMGELPAMVVTYEPQHPKHGSFLPVFFGLGLGLLFAMKKGQKR